MRVMWRIYQRLIHSILNDDDVLEWGRCVLLGLVYSNGFCMIFCKPGDGVGEKFGLEELGKDAVEYMLKKKITEEGRTEGKEKETSEQEYGNYRFLCKVRGYKGRFNKDDTYEES